MDKYGQRVFRSASAFHAVIDGECEAQQLLPKPVVVYLEKSRMCQSKYTLHCVREAAVYLILHVSFWPPMHLLLQWTSFIFLAAVGPNK